ncbi:MAG: MBL fold metallo-hydrolase [Ignavibacteria bacterium]|nr:MBL fold metallo-hydrolase [Ignavibacteria bacterium]
MKIGKYELKAIQTGMFGLDGGAMFGVVPKPLWQKYNPSDEQNRITLGARTLLLDAGKRKILIDTGLGDNWDEKFKQIYKIEQPDKPIITALKKENLSAYDITDVILTHLHFDHTGGSTSYVEGKWIPTFQNATYYIQRKHFEWAIKPVEKDRASFIQNRFFPLQEAGVLKLLEEDEFDNEIELIVLNGHTFSQQMIKISDSSKTLVYCGDLLPTSTHIPLPYVMGYDLQPLVTIEEKKKLYSNALNENWYLFFEHDPKVVAATITDTNKGFILKDVFTELPIDRR